SSARRILWVATAFVSLGVVFGSWMLFWQDGQPGESNAAATRREARELGQWPVQDGRIRSLSAGGARAVYCLEDGSARLIDLNSGREIRRWANDKHILAAALSSDGNQVVRVVNVIDGPLIAVIDGKSAA
ncbi:hypothetical protein, partial [Nocardioides sp.]|uniref:hypothetical protein n=1 Tax=Nocardioides sp. TaxID=35761 RepID=UPI003D0A1308